MIDIGRMETVLNGAAIAEANAARTAAEEARQTVATSRAAEVVTSMAMTAPTPVVAENLAADDQTLLRFAYLGSMGLLTPGQFASVGERLRTANVEVPNGAGGAGWKLAF